MFCKESNLMDKKRRTTLLTLLALGAGYSGLRYVPSLLPEKLVLTDLESPSGFRQYSAGETSSGSFNPFAGLDTDNDLARREAETRADKRVSSNVCRALYAELDLNPDQVPIASFSDYYCPYCRVQTKRLAALAKGNETEFAVAWHELPLLGETSNLAARAALAAKRQGAYTAFHERLMRTPFSVSPEYFSRLSEDLGVNEAKLLTDVNSADIDRELEDSAALSRVFAFVGTPALVIGRTVVQGQISDRMIKRIVEQERAEGWATACGYV
jgi:protein-disulfide isomerase